MKKFITLLTLVYLLLCISQRSSFAEENKAQELFSQGQTAESQGDTARAIEMYEKSIEANPDLASAYNALGLIYLDQQSNVDDVIWLFQQAADIEPQNAEYYTNMCRAYFQNQKFDWAESACLKSLSIDQSNGPAKMTLAYVYLLGKAQPAESIKYFKELLEKLPNPKIYFGLGMAYARNNEPAKALDIITFLRGKGEENLASQLERMIRPSGEVMSAPTAAAEPAPVEATPSALVTAKPPKKAVEQNASQTQPGVMHIKLKAKLAPVAGAPVVADANSKKTKNTSDDEAQTEPPVESAIERVKKMRGSGGTARVRGNTSVTVQGTASVTSTPAATP